VLKMGNFEVLSPGTIEETLSYFGTRPNSAILAGGTDIVVKMRDGLLNFETLIDISGVKELKRISIENGLLKIGAACTLAEIAENDLIKQHGLCLAQVAEEVGAVQIRNRATIGGNIGNASPAADTVPALIALGATATIMSRQGTKQLLVEELFVGPGKTILGSGEIITSISFPVNKGNEVSCYLKLGKRRAQAIAVVNIAVKMGLDENNQRFEYARIALGSVAPTAIRIKKAEENLIGKEISFSNIDAAAAIVEEQVKPISDVRASALYRSKVSRKLAIKAICEALAQKGIEVES